MTSRLGAVAVLFVVAFITSAPAAFSATQQPHASSGFHEASAKRGVDLARAPDGTVATDLPLPVIRAHHGVQNGPLLDHDDDTSPTAPKPTSTLSNPQAPVSLWLLLAMTMVMSLLSGVGALPYLFTGKLDPYWSGIANAVGCGVMLAASFDLLEESKTYSAVLVMFGIMSGVVAMAASQSWLSRFEDVSFSDLQGADARKAMLILGVMAAHAFGEGSGVGVSFSGPRGWAQGLLVTIAIGLHNIPEGMAVATIMVARGTPPKTALFWTLLSALPQGIVALPSYLFVETFSSLLPIALGFAAGCMIWIVFAELIPDALETAEHGHVATAATLSAAALQCISMVIAKLERPDGTVASPIAADLSQLLPSLLLLLPGLLAPCVGAGLAGVFLPSLPLSMGLTVGASAWAGLAGLMNALVRHHHHYHNYPHDPDGTQIDHRDHHGGKHAVVLWAAAGAATCAALWRALGALDAAGQQQQHKEQQHGSQLGSGSLEVERVGGSGAGQVDNSGAEERQWTLAGAQLQQQQLVGEGFVGAVGGHAVGMNGWGTAAAGHGVCGVALGSPLVGGSSSNRSTDSTVHASGIAVGRGGGGGVLERRNGFGGGSALMHCQGNCSCKECDAKHAHHPADAWVARMDLLPAEDRPRDCVRGAVAVGAMMVLGVLPSAFDVAGTLLGHLGAASALLPPLVLRGLLLGAACVGVVRAVAGTPGWRAPTATAALLAAAAVATVSSLLLSLPVGHVAAEDIRLDPSGWAARLHAFTSGGMLLAAVGYLWPAAAHFKPRRVQVGVLVGLGLGCCGTLLEAALCAGTPYCLSGRAWSA